MNFLDGEVAMQDGAARFRLRRLDVPLANYEFDKAGAQGRTGDVRHPARSTSR